MPSNQLQNLLLQINGNSESAVQAIKAVSDQLEKLIKKQDDVHKEVAKGQAIWDITKKGLEFVYDGVKDLITALPELVQHTAETADHFWVMSKQTGIAADALAELDYVGSQTGTSLETITANVFQMSRRLGDASGEVTRAVRDLGLNMDKLREETPEEQFKQIIKALGKEGIAGTAREAADGTAIFSRQFRQMRQVVGQNIDVLIARFHAMGGGMSDALAELGNALTDAEDDFNRFIANVKQAIGVGFLPAFTTILTGINNAIIKALDAGNIDLSSLSKKIQDGMRYVVIGVMTMIEQLSQLLPLGVELFVKFSVEVLNVLRDMATQLTLVFGKLLSSPAALGLIYASLGETGVKALRDLANISATAAAGTDALSKKLEKSAPEFKKWAEGVANALKDIGAESGTLYDKFINDLSKPGEKKKTGPKPLTQEEISKIKDSAAAAQKAQIQIEKEGLEQRLALFDLETSEMLRKMEEAGARKEVVGAQAAAREKERELLLVEFRRGLRDQSIKLVEDGIKRQIEIEKDGEDRKVALIRAGIQIEIAQEEQRIGAVAAAEEAFIQWKSDKIRDGEDQIRKIRHDAAEQSRLAARAQAYESAEETINITQEGLTRELSLLQLNANKKMDALAEEHLSEQEELKRQAAILEELEDKSDAAITKNKQANRQQRLDDEAAYQIAFIKLTETGRKAAVDIENVEFERELARLEEKKARDTANEAEIDRQIENLRRNHYARLAGIDAQYLGRTKEQVKTALQNAEAELAIMKKMGGFTQQAIHDKEEEIKRLRLEKSVLEEISFELHKMAGFAGLVSDMFGTIASVVGGKFGHVLDILAQVSAAVAQIADDIGNLLTAIAKGDWVAAIAAGIKLAMDGFKALYHLFAKSPEQRAGEEAARDYGIRISKEFAKAIAEQAEKEFGGSRQAAMIFNLDKLIQQAGGLDVHSVDTFRNFKKGLMDIFVMFDQGKFSADQFTDALARNLEVFMKYAAHDATGQSLAAWAEAANKLFSEFEAGRITVDQLNQALGDTVNELAQMATESPAALETFVAVAARMITEFKEGKLSAAELNKALSSGFQTITQDAIKHNKILSDSFVELMVNARKAGVEIDGLDEFFNAMNDKLAKGSNSLITGFVDTLKNATDKGKKSAADIRIAYQSEFDRISRITLAAFNGMVANGMSAFDAIEANGDAFDKLAEAAKNFGFKGNAAFDQLSRWRQLTKDNKGLFEELSGVNDIMLALANTGSLDAQTFADLQAQATSTAARMKEAGFSQEEIIAAMKPTLETIIKLHKERGLAIDEETQKLIDQGLANGQLQEEQASVQDVLKEGLSEIIRLLGGELPEAWKKSADAAKKAAGDTKSANKDMADSTTQVVGQMTSEVAGASQTMWATYSDGLLTGVDATSTALTDVAEAVTDGITNTTKETTTAFTDLLGIMKGDGARTWQDWRRNAEGATDKTTDGVVDVKEDGMDVLSGAISGQEAYWRNWRDIAVSAANDVAAAVNAISFGHSPGGIKEIPLKFAEATHAAERFASLTVGHLDNVYRRLPNGTYSFGLNDVTSAAAAQVQQQASADGGSIHATFHISTIDADGFEEVVNSKVYPKLIKLLRRGGRPLTDLQRIINS